MRRTQLYLPEEYHHALTQVAQIKGHTLSKEVRTAIEAYLEKSKIKTIIRKKTKEGQKPGKNRPLPFADMVGIFSGPKDTAAGVDEIYDDD